MHKIMALFFQGSVELWWTHSNHKALITADQKGCDWPTVAQLSFAQIGNSGQKTVTVLLPPITSWPG